MIQHVHKFRYVDTRFLCSRAHRQFVAKIAHCVKKFREWQLLWHKKHFIDRFAWPVRISQFFYGKQINAAADGLACTQKLLPFFIGADTKDGDWSPIRHAEPPQHGEAAKYTPLLARRKQKPEKRRDALRPGCLVVLGAFYALVVQVPFILPAAMQQHITIPLDVFDNPRTFARSDIQPDPRARVHRHTFGEFMNHALVPPYRWRKRRNFSKYIRAR